MSMILKVANPLHYPLAVLAGGVMLFLGVRVARLPSLLVVPTAMALAGVGAVIRHHQEPALPLGVSPHWEQVLRHTRQQTLDLTRQAAELHKEAQQVLLETDQIELLGLVGYTCDRTQELPNKIEQLTHRLQGRDSLLSVADLERQLVDVQEKQRHSSGIAQEQWNKLADSLERNIQLAKQGSDTRAAQVASLSTLILDAAGLLQQLQIKLRTNDIKNSAVAAEIRTLSDEFSQVQDNISVFIAE
jgi:hypothetical protein